MEKSIAVINFNMIMGNVINLYANRVNIEEYPTISWRILTEELKINPISDLRYDSDVLYQLADFIAKKMSKKGTILKCLDNITDDEDIFNMEDDTVYKITNFDFFPCYNEDNDLVEKDKVNIMNWILYLIDHGKSKIELNTWVKSYNSDINPLLIERGLTCRNLSTYKTSDSYDEIILIYSPLYVPNEYRHLCDMIINLTKYIKRG